MGAASVEPAPLMVPDAPLAAVLLELELEPALLLELLLPLEPQAATPSDARTATATALMRLLRNVFLLQSR